jgi:hypothetical protein
MRIVTKNRRFLVLCPRQMQVNLEVSVGYNRLKRSADNVAQMCLTAFPVVPPRMQPPVLGEICLFQIEPTRSHGTGRICVAIS